MKAFKKSHTVSVLSTKASESARDAPGLTGARERVASLKRTSKLLRSNTIRLPDTHVQKSNAVRFDPNPVTDPQMHAGISSLSIKGLASVSNAGRSPMTMCKPNQDRCWTVDSFASIPGQYFCGVADGHGVNGHDVSGLIKSQLPRILEQHLGMDGTNPKSALSKAYTTLNESICASAADTTLSGSTCVSVLLQGRDLYCANVGDSRAVMGSLKPSGEWTATALSTDHKPDCPSEQKRIIAAGGRVGPYRGSQGEALGPHRVWLKTKEFPGLAMSRSFGDKVAATVGVIAEPQVTHTAIGGTDKIVIIASDGVWEFLSNMEAVWIVAMHYLSGDAATAAEQLCAKAACRWREEEVETIDDITAIVLFFN